MTHLGRLKQALDQDAGEGAHCSAVQNDRVLCAQPPTVRGCHLLST